MRKLPSIILSTILATGGILFIGPPAQATKLTCSDEQIEQEARKGKIIRSTDVTSYTRAGCELVGRKIEFPSGTLATIPAPGVTVVGSGLAIDGEDELPETYATMSETGQMAFAERHSDGTEALIGDTFMKLKLKTVIGQREKQSPQATSLLSQKCTYSTTNTDLLRWPDGVSYDWWMTENSNYPPPYGQTQLNVWNITGGSKSWQNRKTSCPGSYPAHKASTNYKGTSIRSASINSDTTCGPASDWYSLITFKSLANAPQPTLAYTCWYPGINGGIWEADIAFNSDYSWALRDNGYLLCSPGQFILEGVATHEFGHAFGLSHAPQSSDQVMRPNSSSCTTTDTELGTGDLASINHHYHY